MIPNIQDLIDFAQEAGDLAYDMQTEIFRDGLETEVKRDASLVTAADLAVTKLFREKFAAYITHPDHAVIDEESWEDASEDERQWLRDKAQAARYTWAMDPVDGTVSFAAGSPLWAVSIGVMKDGQPWMGVIYMPALRELLFCDGESSYVVTAQTGSAPRKLEMKGQDAFPGKPILHPATAFKAKIALKEAGFYPIAPWAATFVISWIALDRQQGCLSGPCKIWDVSAGYAIAKGAGAGGFALPERKDVFQTDMRPLLQDNWRFGVNTICCRPQDFAEIYDIYADAYEI